MEPQFPHLSYDFLEGPVEKPSAFLYSGNGVLAREINTYSTNQQLSCVTGTDLTKVTPQGAPEGKRVLAHQIPSCLAWALRVMGENGCWLPGPSNLKLGNLLSRRTCPSLLAWWSSRLGVRQAPGGLVKTPIVGPHIQSVRLRSAVGLENSHF